MGHISGSYMKRYFGVRSDKRGLSISKCKLSLFVASLSVWMILELFLALPVSAEESNLNQVVDNHLGVASCSESTCHGSNVTFSESNVLRNEFRIWNESDPHARAYATLLHPDSVRIARNLGIASAAESNLCLGCHADNVSVELRGEEFKIEDGIGCEVCHGGAERYIDSHTNGQHQDSLADGLYPSEEPLARAQLCVSCHVGNTTDRKITHEIMGAGHPRLSFELNTFSTIQPAHYVVDADYKQRKGDITELQVWAMGQVVAAKEFLVNVKAFPKSGLFPELVHMDCLGCHQEMSKVNWSNNPLTDLPAGALRYNDAYLMMTYQIALAVRPQEAGELLKSIKAFLQSTTDVQTLASSIAPLKTNLDQLQDQLLASPITNDQGMVILKSLVDVGLLASHKDYASAEQSAMAINSVMRVLDAEGKVSRARKNVVEGVDRIFESLENEDEYDAKRFISGLKRVGVILSN